MMDKREIKPNIIGAVRELILLRILSLRCWLPGYSVGTLGMAATFARPVSKSARNGERVYFPGRSFRDKRRIIALCFGLQAHDVLSRLYDGRQDIRLDLRPKHPPDAVEPRNKVWGSRVTGGRFGQGGMWPDGVVQHHLRTPTGRYSVSFCIPGIRGARFTSPFMRRSGTRTTSFSAAR